MFSVGYGVANREKKILTIAKSDPNHALILAAVHFEWVIKRSILKLGSSPTASLRKELENTYKLAVPNSNKDYRAVWKREVASRFKGSSLGTVLGNLHDIQNKTLKARGRVIHGNGTISKKEANIAVLEFLKAAGKLEAFTKKHGEDLDSRLRTRIKSR